MTEALPQELRGAVLRTHGKYCIWVQSPKHRWLLLSGFWPTRLTAVKYIAEVGYVEMAWREALPLIEAQMEQRLLDLTDFHRVH